MVMALVLWLWAGVVAPPEPVSLSGVPIRAFAPAAFRLVVTVERNPDNRELAVVIDGDSYFRRSDEQLDGLDAPRIRTLAFDHIPEGHYVITAAVVRSDHSIVRAQNTVCILGMNETCQ